MRFSDDGGIVHNNDFVKASLLARVQHFHFAGLAVLGAPSPQIRCDWSLQSFLRRLPAARMNGHDFVDL